MDNFKENNLYPEMIVLGSTGSVGTQACDVAQQHGIRIKALSAGKNVDLIEEQIRKFKVSYCAMSDAAAARDLKVRTADLNVHIYSGTDGICNMLADCRGTEKQVVQNAITGRAGLEPTLTTIRSGYRLALANKESLVVAGHLVMQAVRKYSAEMVPVDSEHSAIYQCLRSGNHNEVKKIWLTASGGPFKGMKREQLSAITREQALAHPTWKMGPKITVDSATLMNKGFEVIEAVHLFGVRPEQIRVVVHKESIVHSMVEYVDNSIIAQLSVPDMRQCVQYAMTDPVRLPASISPLDLTKMSGLTFADPDMQTFKLLPCAIQAIRLGGALPAVVNAANEVAVDAFLHERLSFTGIMDLVCEITDRLSEAHKYGSMEDILSYDAASRKMASERIH